MQEKFINIPTLDQVFDILCGHTLINIEIKVPKPNTIKPRYQSKKQLLYECLHKFFVKHPSYTDWCFISSFSHKFLQEFRAY